MTPCGVGFAVHLFESHFPIILVIPIKSTILKNANGYRPLSRNAASSPFYKSCSESSITVKGPSFTSDTFISAPKLPFSTIGTLSLHFSIIYS